MPANTRLSSPASRWSHFSGLLHDEFDLESHWLRLEARIAVPAYPDVRHVVLQAAFAPWPAAERAGRPPSLEVTLNGARVALVAPSAPGPFEVPIALPEPRDGETNTIGLRLHGTAWTDNLAWLGTHPNCSAKSLRRISVVPLSESISRIIPAISLLKFIC